MRKCPLKHLLPRRPRRWQRLRIPSLSGTASQNVVLEQLLQQQQLLTSQLLQLMGRQPILLFRLAASFFSRTRCQTGGQIARAV